MIMNAFQSIKKLIGALLLALVASVMLVACSSSEEEPPPADTSGGGGGESCADQCAAVPDMNQDECIIACEA